MRQRRGIAFIGAILCTALLSFGTLSAYAEDSTTTSDRYSDSSTSSGGQTRTDGTSDRDKARQEVEKLRAEAKRTTERMQNMKDRLDGRRLQACEAHQEAIKRILTHAATRGENHITLFSTITAKVEAFYTKKGKTLATYDQLVSNVLAKKAAAQTAVEAVKTASTGFSCSSDNPKGQIAAFKAEIKAENAALKEYRTAVKNLIVGVKSVQSTSENGS